MRYKIWNKQDTLYTPSGDAFTKDEIFAKYPLSQLPTVDFIICDAPINMGVFMEYSQTKETYKQMGANITDGMTQQQVLDAITAFENTPVVSEPTAEERLAAAAEFDNLINL